jgi:hypothetical protein
VSPGREISTCRGADGCVELQRKKIEEHYKDRIQVCGLLTLGAGPANDPKEGVQVIGD